MYLDDKTPAPARRVSGLDRVTHGGVDLAELERFLVNPENVLDLSTGFNPYGPPATLPEVLARTSFSNTNSPYALPLREAIASELRLMPTNVTVGNGTTELIYLLAQAYLDEGDKALVLAPCSPHYARAARISQAEVIEYRAQAAQNFMPDLDAIMRLVEEHHPRLVFLSNPAIPSGVSLKEEHLAPLAEAISDAGGMLIIDETYLNLTDPVLNNDEEFNSLELLYGMNLALVRSFSNEFNLPGLPISYILAPSEVNKAVQLLQPPFVLSTYAQEAGKALVSEKGWLATVRGRLFQDKLYLVEQLNNLGLAIMPGKVNFVLVKAGEQATAASECRHFLLRQGVIVRDCASYGLPEYIRVAVNEKVATDRLIVELSKWLETQRLAKPAAIMLNQNTTKGKTILIMSGARQAGKTTVLAGLGNALVAEGLKSVPFKPLTLSSNLQTQSNGEVFSYEAANLAQAYQLEPNWQMNPVVVTQESDDKCKVSVGGKPQATLTTEEYQRSQPELAQIARQALNELQREFELVLIESDFSVAGVLEGAAFSAGLELARELQAPAILLADDERGGAVAELLGTLELLETDERELIKAFIINKATREAQNHPATEFLNRKTNRAVAGILPILDEMSRLPIGAVATAAPASEKQLERPAPIPTLDICVVLLPNIAGFEDFDALEKEPGVEVRYVREQIEIGKPDLAVLPGTRSSIADLQFLEESGLGKALQRLAENGTPVLGIAGGFQMLGELIEDPERYESRAGTVPGLGILPVRSIFRQAKNAGKVTARIEATTGVFQGMQGLTVTATEMLTGSFTTRNGYAFDGPANDSGTGVGSEDNQHHVLRVSRREGGASEHFDGYVNEQGNVWGTNLNGLFTNDNFRFGVLSRLLERKGASTSHLHTKNLQTLARNQNFERLGAMVKQRVSLNFIKKLAGLE